MRCNLPRCTSPKVARLRHADLSRECLLSGVFRKSRFRVARTGFDPGRVETFFVPR
jgi:hypothetical protein